MAICFLPWNKAGEIGIRLPKERAKAFMDKYRTTGFKSYGSFMKDYVLIPESLYGEKELLVGILRESYHYVLSLPP